MLSPIDYCVLAPPYCNEPTAFSSSFLHRGGVVLAVLATATLLAVLHHTLRRSRPGAQAARPRRGLVRQVPVVLAAGVAAVMATTFALGQIVVPAVASGSTPSTFDRQGDGVVKLTIYRPSGEPDVAGMRATLARAGVRARIYAGDPTCKGPQWQVYRTQEQAEQAHRGLAQASSLGVENGEEVWMIHPDKIPADRTLALLYPRGFDARGAGHSVALVPGDGPDCFYVPR
ncbi:hypothetical protein [Kitasatospora sp. NPDC097643]|uniref:hypothetical protein n=1 Tax=Kitasatospora sp. NPDC097643 TaxID=3157230 RepID=UPI003324532E